MRDWFNSLATRDRRAVLAAVAAVALAAFYFLFWEPQMASRQTLEQDIEQQRETLAWMRGAAAEASALAAGEGQAGAPRAGKSLLGLVDRTARAATLSPAITRMEPQGTERVRIWLKDADFDRVVAWLGQLRRQHGMQVSNLDLERGKAPGMVGGRLALGYRTGR
ncbi:MAG: type II secretion system protein M [Gammaproteobacteria bacterium]|nr:type II secretion system protein M [Gammaproteobacteria bacterium]